jgi:ribosome assembly protein YihI (activator of Der GTPase)
MSKRNAETEIVAKHEAITQLTAELDASRACLESEQQRVSENELRVVELQEALGRQTADADALNASLQECTAQRSLAEVRLPCLL